MDNEIMVGVKKVLNCVPENKRNDEYKEICRMVNLYIFSRCQHEFETDLFDIDPERSMIVKYCVKCEYQAK